MKVAFSPWTTVRTAAATGAPARGRRKKKQVLKGIRTSSFALEASFVSRARGAGRKQKQGKRQRRHNRTSNGDGISGTGSSSVPLLALTTDHKVYVLSTALSSESASSSSTSATPSLTLTEDSRWSYESRPGSASSFLPAPVSSSESKPPLSGNNGVKQQDDDVTDDAVPPLPAIFDPPSSHIFALQNGNTVLSCWDSSDAKVTGPDDDDAAKASRVTLPPGRFAVSMHNLPSTDTCPVDGGGVAGVLDDGTVFVARFVSATVATQTHGSLAIGYYEGGDAVDFHKTSNGRKERGRRAGKRSPRGLQHVSTMISPGSGAPIDTDKSSGKKRKASISNDAGESFTIRVLFYNGDNSTLCLIRHNLLVQSLPLSDKNQNDSRSSCSCPGLGGDIESFSYPPICLSLPSESDSEVEEPLLVDTKSIRCARLDSTALAVAYRVTTANVDDIDSSGDSAIIDDGTWYAIHLESRTGDVTNLPFPLELLPGWSVAKIAGLSPNLVAVLSTLCNSELDEEDAGRSIASLVVYDIRRSVAVQSVDLPLDNGHDINNTNGCWDMLSDYKDGSIALLTKSQDESSASVSVSKLTIDANDATSAHSTTALKRKYNLASAIASAVSVSDDAFSGSTAVAVRDIRSIVSPTNTNNNVEGEHDEEVVETIVSETMQAIDDVFVAFELDGIRASMENDKETASFEAAYDQAVCSLLDSSSSQKVPKGGVTPVNGNKGRITPASPNSIANGSSHHNLPKKKAQIIARRGGLNTQLLPQSFVDGVFDMALSIILDPSKNEEPNSDTTRSIGAALRVMIKLVRTGKVSARDHLGNGVIRTVLLACRRFNEVSPASAETDMASSASNIIDSVLSHSSDDVPESVLVAMLHYILCYTTIEDMVGFVDSKVQSRQSDVPEKFQMLVEQRNETMAELLMIERGKAATAKKRKKKPTKKKNEESEARIEELKKIGDESEASILSSGTIYFANRIVSYSTANGSLLRSALASTLVHATQGEINALLLVLTKLLYMPTAKSKASLKATTACRVASISQWISALVDAHLPVLLSEESASYVAAAKEAVSASAAQAVAVVGLQELMNRAIAVPTESVADSQSETIGNKLVIYDSTGKKRLTSIVEGQEDKRSGPIPPYSIERLII